MAGIYLHIPFCKQACTYCNFHFTTSLLYKDELVKALVQEVKAETDYLEGESVQTIYFGGGTPSLLSPHECEIILGSIRKRFLVDPLAEITLEANPDDITPEKLIGWRQAGINRLSIGVQSFDEEELRWMNRAHNARQAYQSIEFSHQYGFHNLSIDLIFGSPLLNDERWQQNINQAITFDIPHLSCYALTVEEKTPLRQLIRNHFINEVDQDQQARQFLLLMNRMREHQYEHYEVSNFAKKGCRSRHNSAYWKGEKYLGLGPSAHSFNGKERRWNIANNQLYIQGQKNQLPQRETELLTRVQALNEYIMISLRTGEGLDLCKLENDWGTSVRLGAEKALERFLRTGLVRITNDQVQLNDEGMLMADGIASALFNEPS